MAERYARLFSLPENQYTVGSPILIAAGALLKDNQTGKVLAQIKFKNISDKQIKAVKISIDAFDVSGKELEGIAEYQYLDLAAARMVEFGHKQAVALPDAVTRAYRVNCTGVFFADGSAWNANPDASWNSLPVQRTLTAQLGDLAEQYQRDTSAKSNFVPVEHEDLWFCSCGAINRSGESHCHDCQHSKAELFAALNVEMLRQRNAEYIAANAERRTKTMRFATICVAVIAIIVAASILATQVIIPYVRYNNAIDSYKCLNLKRVCASWPFCARSSNSM